MQTLLKLIRRHKLNQLIKRKFTLPIPLDQLRQIISRYAVALNSTHESLSRNHERENINLQIEIRRRRPNLDALTTKPRHLDRTLNQHRHARRLNRDRRSNPIRNLLHSLHDGLARPQFRRINHMRRAQLLRRKHPALHAINADDDPAARDLRRHDGTQTHAAEALNRNRIAGPCFRDVDDRTAARLDAAAQRREELQFLLAAYQVGRVDHAGLGDDAVVCETGLAEEAAAEFRQGVRVAGFFGAYRREGVVAAEVQLVETVAE